MNHLIKIVNADDFNAVSVDFQGPISAMNPKHVVSALAQTLYHLHGGDAEQAASFVDSPDGGLELVFASLVAETDGSKVAIRTAMPFDVTKHPHRVVPSHIGINREFADEAAEKIEKLWALSTVRTAGLLYRQITSATVTTH